ncbi:MAG: peptidoglycan DD-metalloendopeptidase family protein [Candidatus Moraniibacteriota bacterium]
MLNNKENKISLRRKVLTVFLIALSFFIVWKCFVLIKGAIGKRKILEIPIKQNQSEATQIKKDDFDVVDYTVIDGDIPAEIFGLQGKLDANEIVLLLLATKDVYDFTNIKIGQNLRFYFEKGDGTLKKMEYDRSNEHKIVVERQGGGFIAREEKIAYSVSQEIARGKIDNFFYVDAMESGLSEVSVLEVGDIFSFDVDFTTEIQKDDEFVVVYEKRSLTGEKAPDGKILAAKFVNVGRSVYAYYFDNDGSGGYYDDEGRVLERQFLKAPLSYRHISSGFTGARMHPITKKISAHYQIDYAAPSGTPVVASARGTLVSAGWEGGWGNMVRLSHDNGYTSHYGHLSSFAKGIKSGVRVDQGQVIGYVGSTGWSTGPHLDYGIKLNGTPVNPLKLDLPKGQPLDEERMKIFKELKAQYVELLK